MSSEQIFLLLTAAAAALVGAAALVAVLRERRRAGATSPTSALVAAPDEAPAGDGASLESGPAAYNGVLRILWWLTIAVVLVGVGVSGAYPGVQAQIFGLGGGGVIAVIAFHELFPSARRRTALVLAEALVALGLVTWLLVLTGYGASPFFFAYADRGGRGGARRTAAVSALVVGALATLGYLGVLALDPARAAWTPLDGLRFALNIGSVWLLAYLAGVFAAQERRVRRRVLALSRTDPLTGLYNRGQLFPTLEQEVSRTRRSDRGFCLLMVDLDGLKAVNDTFGHHRGDEVLRAIGGIIHRSIRAVDAAYRYGGDEFLILLPETDIAGAFVVAEKIRTGAEEVGLALTGEDGATSVSIGLGVAPGGRGDRRGADDRRRPGDVPGEEPGQEPDQRQPPPAPPRRSRPAAGRCAARRATDGADRAPPGRATRSSSRGRDPRRAGRHRSVRERQARHRDPRAARVAAGVGRRGR